MPEAIEQVNKSHLRVEQAQQEAHQAKQQHNQYLRSLEATQQVVIDLQRLITGHIVATATAALTGRSGREALVQALPAAGGTAEAATPKRKTEKAITAAFETLDASQASESELPVMAMGNIPFARVTESLEVDEAERRRKLAEAIAFLQQALAGGRRPASAVLHEAAQAGIAERTLYHAKEVLGIESVRQGYTGGHWVWKASTPYEGAKR